MITIIGAGPVGSYSAYLLAKEGKEVNVFEEHKEIGWPIQCTGIVTNEIQKIIPLDSEIIVNSVTKARIFSNNKNYIELNLKNKNLILDRNKLDKSLAKRAEESGAKFFLNHSFLQNKKKLAFIKDKTSNKIKKIKFDHLVGSDGPLSQVAKSNGFCKNKVWHGVQARVKLKNENIVEFYPYFGTYAWVVPENTEIARVGLVSEKYANPLFKNFLFKQKNIKSKDIIEYQSGLIPRYNPKRKAQKNNVYLVGDAAAQVKATTGGGIIQGLIASKALSDSIINKKSYEISWRKSLGKELYLHLRARNIMGKFKQKDWDSLISIMNTERSKKILESENRDNISKIILKLLINNPKLIYYLKYMV